MPAALLILCVSKATLSERGEENAILSLKYELHRFPLSLTILNSISQAV
jgi:hypothetical protein